MKRIEKTVFISYRRADQAWALAIFQRLKQDGFDVFLDYLGLGSGSFEREILENIAARAHFLVILTPHALDRADESGDWLRREIEAAIDLRRNVVPILLPGFSFGDAAVRARLTGTLAALSSYNGLSIPDAFFDAAMDRLERQFLDVALDTVLHPASPDALVAAQAQQTAAAGAAPAAGPATTAERVAATDASGPAAPGAASALPSTITIQGRAGVLEFAWALGGQAASGQATQRFQPAFVERVVRSQVGSTIWRQEIGRMLFQMLVPDGLRQHVPKLDRVLLYVDQYGAGIPWEVLLPDGPEPAAGPARPFALRAWVTRRLTSPPHRPAPGAWAERSALVIGNPSTQGFVEAFPGTTEHPNPAPPDLPGAEAEADLVAKQLGQAGYRVRLLAGQDKSAADVLSAFLAQPWRIMHIAGTGVVDVRHRDGDRRSGVVLSDGVLLTAMELVALPRAPELVFLDCSHLGRVDTGGSGGALADSLLTALVVLGVRCIVVTGWAVSDQGAQTFARVFYEELVQRRQSFGAAIFSARQAVWQADPADITWGAFQAYGDPDWALES